MTRTNGHPPHRSRPLTRLVISGTEFDPQPDYQAACTLNRSPVRHCDGCGAVHSHDLVIEVRGHAEGWLVDLPDIRETLTDANFPATGPYTTMIVKMPERQYLQRNVVSSLDAVIEFLEGAS